MSDEQESGVPLGLQALSYVMDELSYLHRQLAIVTWLCDQMYGVLRGMDEEPTEENFGPWFAQMQEVIGLYDKVFPCCEDCEEEQRLKAEQELDNE